MDYIQIGTIVNTFGLKGELKIVSNSEFVAERFAVANTIWVLDEEYRKFTVSSLRFHKNNILVTLDDMQTINEVENLVGCSVFVHKNDIPTLEDGYYLFELQDLDIYLDGEKIGYVVETMKYSAQSLLRVQLAEKSVLIPFVPAFIENVDLGNKRIDIKVIEGLL